MSKSVSNDALWEKLSEIDNKLDKALKEQKNLGLGQDSKESMFMPIQDRLVAINEKILQLGLSNDALFKTTNENLGIMNDNTLVVLDVVNRICEENESTVEAPKAGNSHFNFKFFKVRKTSVIISILGLLVFILTTFCMKQQNDYSILNGEYYRNRIEIREMRMEMDSLRNAVKPSVEKKR
jgi:hypothetical protein